MSDRGVTSEQLERGKINSETARIPWRDLQRYFAGGRTLWVDARLDLVEVAYQLQRDNVAQTQQWMQQALLRPVSNQQARRWYNDDATLWACVVKPWGLIQPPDGDSGFRHHR